MNRNIYFTKEAEQIIEQKAEQDNCSFNKAVNALVLEASKEKDLRILYTQIRDNMVKLYKRVDLSLKKDREE